MRPLIEKEFVVARKQLTHIFGFLIAAVLILGRTRASMAYAYLTVLPVITAAILPQLSFAAEERFNTFAFLRTLPLSPRAVVGAKYAFVALVLVALELVMVGFVGLYIPTMVPMLPQALSTTVFIASVLSSLSLLLHFWLGVKSAKSVLMLVALVLVLPVGLSGDGGAGTAFAAVVEEWSAFSSTTGGVVTSIVFGALLMLGSWSLSSRIFARRDLSRLT